MAETFTYNVFLSHNAKDKARVRRLAERLRAVRGRAQAPWFDEWVIKPGGSPHPSGGRGVRRAGLAIERRLEATRVQVLCLSPAALGSAWLERSTVGRGNLPFRDLPNAGRHFISLLLADCKLPDTLRR